MTKPFLICGLLAALTACATSQPASTASAASAAAPAVAAAAETTAAAPAAGTVATAGKPKLVCEETQQLGSHFPQRVCMTPEQMEARRKAAQAAMQNYQMQGAQCAQGGGGGACAGPPR